MHCSVKCGFITTSELGQFLNDTYNHTVEELQDSRAQLVEAVTKQLMAGFKKEIDNLKTQIRNLEELKKQSTSNRSIGLPSLLSFAIGYLLNQLTK